MDAGQLELKLQQFRNFGSGLKLQRSFAGLAETCQPAVSKPYRKKVVELKLQQFGDPLETRW